MYKGRFSTSYHLGKTWKTLSLLRSNNEATCLMWSSGHIFIFCNEDKNYKLYTNKIQKQKELNAKVLFPKYLVITESS